MTSGGEFKPGGIIVKTSNLICHNKASSNAALIVTQCDSTRKAVQMFTSYFKYFVVMSETAKKEKKEKQKIFL